MRKGAAKGLEIIEVLVVAAIIMVIAAIAIPNLAASRKGSAPAKLRTGHGVSYVLKNHASYKVELVCSNCQLGHVVEYTIGAPVKTDHKCPFCRCNKGFTVRPDKPPGSPQGTQVRW